MDDLKIMQNLKTLTQLVENEPTFTAPSLDLTQKGRLPFLSLSVSHLFVARRGLSMLADGRFRRSQFTQDVMSVFFFIRLLWFNKTYQIIYKE
jgi:hypothetical protein